MYHAAINNNPGWAVVYHVSQNPVSPLCTMWLIMIKPGWAITVDPAVPVFHLFSSGNPDFIIYMAELRVDEFGMTFQL